MSKNLKIQLTEDEIRDFEDEYHKSIDRLAKFVRFVVVKIENELKEQNVMARVTGRVKRKDSVRKKLEKWAKRTDKALLLREKGLFYTIGDLAAVRVMTYVEIDRNKVADIVEDVFKLQSKKREVKEKDDTRITEDENNFYRATHMQIRLREEDLIHDDISNLRSDHCELQITSMLAHVWNEIEHDIAYKASKSEISIDERTSLESLGLLTKSGDNIISNLIQANKVRIHQKNWENGKIGSDSELVEFLKGYYGELKLGKKAIEFEKNAGSVHRALKCLEMLHPDDIIRNLSPKDIMEAYPQAQELEKFMNKKNINRNKIEPLTCDTVYLALLKTCPNLATLREQEHGSYRGVAITKYFKECFRRSD